MKTVAVLGGGPAAFGDPHTGEVHDAVGQEKAMELTDCGETPGRRTRGSCWWFGGRRTTPALSSDVRNRTLCAIENWTPGLSGVAPRLGRMRISPHVYNDEADADRFVAALTRRLQG